MNNTPQVRWLASAILAIILVLSACAQADSLQEAVKTVVVTQEVVREGETIIETQIVEVVVRPAATEAPAEAYPAPAGMAITAAPPQAYPAPSGMSIAQAPSRQMVIKDAELSLLVRDTGLAISQVNSLVADYAGYILSSQSWYEGDYQHATLRLGVPSDTFELVLNQLRKIGLQVLNETASGQDVTAEYVDLQSRLANLDATAARVRSFLEDADSVEEALVVNQKLSELEAQIEQIKGQMRYFEGRTAYSTVTVTLVPEVPTPTPTPLPTPRPPQTWNPGKTFHQASRVLVRSSQSLVDSLIWILVVVVPLVLVGLLPLALLAWGLRAWRARQRKVQTPS